MDAYGYATELLGCLCTKVEEACFCGIVTGAQLYPVDACLCGAKGCGTAWVRLDSAFPSSTFPNVDNTVTFCHGPLAYRFHIGVMRCVPGLDAKGNPPTAAQLLPSSQQIMEDADMLMEVARCCFGELHRKQVLTGPWVPLGQPDGNCAGGFVPITVWSARR